MAMQLRRILPMAILVVLGAVFVFREQAARVAQKEEKAKRAELLAPGFVDGLETISLKSKDGLFHFKKIDLKMGSTDLYPEENLELLGSPRDSIWRLETDSGKSVIADRTIVSSILSTLGKARVADRFPAADSADGFDYQLNPAILEVTLKTKDKEQVVFWGAKHLALKQRYVRLSSNPEELILVDDSLFRMLSGNVSDFRLKRPIPCTSEMISSFYVSKKSKGSESALDMGFERSEKAWKFKHGDREFLADKTLLEDISKELCSQQALSLLDDPSVQLTYIGSGAKRFDLRVRLEPSLEITLHFIADHAADRAQSVVPHGYYVQPEGSPFVYRIAGRDYTNLIAMPSYYRPKKPMAELIDSADSEPGSEFSIIKNSTGADVACANPREALRALGVLTYWEDLKNENLPSLDKTSLEFSRLEAKNVMGKVVVEFLGSLIPSDLEADSQNKQEQKPPALARVEFQDGSKTIAVVSAEEQKKVSETCSAGDHKG